jgi:protease-4
MRLFGRIVILVLAAFGGAILLFGGLGLWAAFHARPASLPKQMVLALDLNEAMAEGDADGPLGKFGLHRGYALRDVIEALDRAARDPQVTAVVARLDQPHLGMAQIQELRDAILAFRKSNKRAVVYSTGLGQAGSGTGAYYLATSFGEIWLQPSGDVALTGFMAESPFLKGTLDLLDIKPEFGARYEYKSAIETFTQTKFTRESRDSLQLLIDRWSQQVIDGIAETRAVKPEQAKALIDQSPLLAAESLQAHLVDRLAYWDELEKTLNAGGAKLVDLNEYAARLVPEATAVSVALIYGVGPVQQGDGDHSPFSRNGIMSSERITKAFRDAVKDPTVKAILFRIDSPGGSYTASDSIWREVGNARAAGKPVVVSMGDVAASGGYFAAMAADRIVAEPGTITGSIGVFSGKLVLADFWKKLGVSWDEVHSGRNATMWSANSAFSPAAWERMNVMLDHIYGDFTTKAESARRIKPDDMDKLARGRIWPGSEAKRLGLIDETGGYEEAFVLLRQLTHQPTQMPVRLTEFPKRKEAFDYLMEIARSGHLPSDLGAGLAAQGKLLTLLETLTPILAWLPPMTQSELRMAPLAMP